MSQISRGALVCWMLLVHAGPALAQQDQGMVAGRVTDPSDAVVSGAVVTATSANGATAATRTNADGHYLLAPLVIGRYQITVEAPAFKRAVSDAVDVHAGARVRVDVQLELGAPAETISVQPRAALLDTETSSLTGRPRAITS